MTTRIQPTRVLVTFFEALAITWALLYLGEYFGWHWVREAGGAVFAARGHDAQFAKGQSALQIPFEKEFFGSFVVEIDYAARRALIKPERSNTLSRDFRRPGPSELQGHL